MKGHLFLATAMLGVALSLSGEVPTSANSKQKQPDLTKPTKIDVTDKTGNIAMIGDAEIQTEIGVSLRDHRISGVQWKVTNNEIDLWGDVLNKHERKVTQEVAEAYADGRKVHDEVKLTPHLASRR